MKPLLATALVLGSLAAPSALPAQQRMLTIFGDDKCPADTICVVAPESERYRIPGPLRAPTKSPESTSWAVRSQATLDEGRTGTDSCSAVGPGGWTGCWAKQMREAAEEAKQREAAQTVP